MSFGDVMDEKRETIELVLSLVNKFGLENKGSLFVLSDKDLSKNYELLYPDLFSGRSLNIRNSAVRLVLEKLADLDGAFILNYKGEILAYGAKIKKQKCF